MWIWNSLSIQNSCFEEGHKYLPVLLWRIWNNFLVIIMVSASVLIFGMWNFKFCSYSYSSISCTCSIKRPGLKIYKRYLLNDQYNLKNKIVNIQTYCLCLSTKRLILEATIQQRPQVKVFTSGDRRGFMPPQLKTRDPTF